MGSTDFHITENTPESVLADSIGKQCVSLVQLAGEGKGRIFELPLGSTVIGTSQDCQVVLADKAVSRRHCQVDRTSNSLRITDLSSTNGTAVDGVTVESARLTHGSAIRVGNSSFGVSVEYEPVTAEGDERAGFRGLVGQSPRMRAIFAAREQLSNSDVTLLLQGETGTGKSALARSIHQASTRRDSPFIVFDCAAVAPTLIESELFGHEKGAFTNADRTRTGAIEAAGDGTLFIDELTELPLDLQPKLLRALEEREFKRVGSSTAIAVKCRIITASQVDVWKLSNEKKFRKDLYFRIAVVVVPIPPLRERKEDLRAIVDQLLNVMEAPILRFSHLPEPVRNQILSHDWPGNVRELRNFLERYVVTKSATFHAHEESAAGTANDTPAAEPTGASPANGFDLSIPFRITKQQAIDSLEKAYLSQLLQSTNGKVAKAARISGINRRHLYDMIERHGLTKSSTRGETAGVGANERDSEED